MRGHTGGGPTMGRGFPISVLTKQKLNMRISTESELVGVNDMIPLYAGLVISCCHRDMGSLRTYCDRIIKAQSYCSRLESLEWQAHEAYLHPILLFHGSGEHEGN